MSKQLDEACEALEALANGVWDNPSLMKQGAIHYDVDLMATEIKRRYLVVCGFTIGPRDPRLNRNYPGKFMVVESHEECELPTDDGSNGPWCVVGDDEAALIADAWDCWADEAYYVDASRNAPR